MRGAKKSRKPHDEVDEYLADMNARSMFISGSVNLGWRLAIAFLVPILVSIKADEVFGTEPSLTIAGFMIAAFASCVVVYSAVKEANAQYASEPKNVKKMKKYKEQDVS